MYMYMYMCMCMYMYMYMYMYIIAYERPGHPGLALLILLLCLLIN